MGTILDVEQTDTMTPDFIRNRLEVFLKANSHIEITDNNFSFPIGQRPEWDHYRITKQPSAWFHWNAVFKSHGCEDVEFEINVFVSNVHSVEHPARMLLECNRMYGRSTAYWNMVREIRYWILEEIDDPIMYMEDLRLRLNRVNNGVLPIPQFNSITFMNNMVDHGLDLDLDIDLDLDDA
jgi:hypothetical protein